MLVLVVIAAAVAGYVLIRDAKNNDSGTKNIEKIKATTVVAPQPEKVSNNSINNNNNMELGIKTTQEGTGEKVVKNGDTIAVHYTGTLTNGTKFDSSVDRGTPFEFQIGQGMVIEGWEKGFIGAKVGEKRILTIPAEMGYGSRSMGSIPANSTLIFDIEILKVQKLSPH